MEGIVSMECHASTLYLLDRLDPQDSETSALESEDGEPDSPPTSKNPQSDSTSLVQKAGCSSEAGGNPTPPPEAPEHEDSPITTATSQSLGFLKRLRPIGTRSARRKEEEAFLQSRKNAMKKPD